MTTVPDLADLARPVEPIDLWSPARRRRLVGLCARIVHDPVVAEDLAQETLLEAWRHHDRLVDPSGADAWLDAIARNVCRRWLRVRGRLPVPVAEAPDAGWGGDLDAVLEHDELVALLDHALGLLPAATRDALVGHYVDELSHAEIADRLETSADAVSMRVSRGRARLRHLLETTYADDVVAEGWSRRDDVGWRPTRLHCPDCGTATTTVRHTAEEVAFRCRRCSPHGIAVRVPLDAAALAAVVGGVRRPSAVRARIAGWVRSYWRVHPGQEPIGPCVRCGAAVAQRTYVRPDVEPWAGRHGWWTSCAACGTETSSSVAGLVLALPRLDDVRRREPGLRLVPARPVEHGGRPAHVLEVRARDGRPLLAAVVRDDDLRLVSVTG